MEALSGLGVAARYQLEAGGGCDHSPRAGLPDRQGVGRRGRWQLKKPFPARLRRDIRSGGCRRGPGVDRRGGDGGGGQAAEYRASARFVRYCQGISGSTRTARSGVGTRRVCGGRWDRPRGWRRRRRDAGARARRARPRQRRQRREGIEARRRRRGRDRRRGDRGRLDRDGLLLCDRRMQAGTRPGARERVVRARARHRRAFRRSPHVRDLPHALGRTIRSGTATSRRAEVELTAFAIVELWPAPTGQGRRRRRPPRRAAGRRQGRAAEAEGLLARVVLPTPSTCWLAALALDPKMATRPRATGLRDAVPAPDRRVRPLRAGRRVSSPGPCVQPKPAADIKRGGARPQTRSPPPRRRWARPSPLRAAALLAAGRIARPRVEHEILAALAAIEDAVDPIDTAAGRPLRRGPRACSSSRPCSVAHRPRGRGARSRRAPETAFDSLPGSSVPAAARSHGMGFSRPASCRAPAPRRRRGRLGRPDRRYPLVLSVRTWNGTWRTPTPRSGSPDARLQPAATALGALPRDCVGGSRRLGAGADARRRAAPSSSRRGQPKSEEAERGNHSRSTRRGPRSSPVGGASERRYAGADARASGTGTGLFDTIASLRAGDQRRDRRGGRPQRALRARVARRMTAAGSSNTTRAEGTYTLPPEHAACDREPPAPATSQPAAVHRALRASVEDEIVDCFRNGGGVALLAIPEVPGS